MSTDRYHTLSGEGTSTLRVKSSRFLGYAFPVETMPPLMQVVANLFPLKHWLVIFRGILLKGAGLQVFWRDLLAIAGLGTVIYAGTVLLMRRKRLA